MPIHFDSIVNFQPVENIGIFNKLLFNPIATAFTLTILIVAILAIFFPLKSNKFKQYFKIMVYYGLITSVALTIHDSIVIKSVEKKYQNDEPVADDLPDKIQVAPRLGGFVLAPAGESGANEVSEVSGANEQMQNEKELDDIISGLENEDIFESDEPEPNDSLKMGD